MFKRSKIVAVLKLGKESELVKSYCLIAILSFKCVLQAAGETYEQKWEAVNWEDYYKNSKCQLLLFVQLF